MQELLGRFRNQKYPLTAVAHHSGVPYHKLWRCYSQGIELRESDAKAVRDYAAKVDLK